MRTWFSGDLPSIYNLFTILYSKSFQTIWTFFYSVYPLSLSLSLQVIFDTGDVFQIRMAVATDATESILYVNYQVEGNLPVGEDGAYTLDAYTER